MPCGSICPASDALCIAGWKKWASAQVPPTPPNGRGGTGNQPVEYDVAHDPTYIYIYTEYVHYGKGLEGTHLFCTVVFWLLDMWHPMETVFNRNEWDSSWDWNGRRRNDRIFKVLTNMCSQITERCAEGTCYHKTSSLLGDSPLVIVSSNLKITWC